MSDRPLPPAPPRPPMVGGRYALRGEVGRGGMATVHRAHDEVLDRAVAVKLLHAHLASDPAFLDRFRREARAAAALSHPNVVAVHDWGETEDGPYLVLQLVDGSSLREVIRRQGRLTPGEALWVLGPAGAGLGAAHDAGFVHRDVKPENLLLSRDGTVRVTDFGLARAAASATSTFGADVLVGSPHYLSPEAVRGQPLDPRADVYALGVVLFECLTGRPPHEGESPFATAVQHTSHPVPAPSSVVPDLSPEVDEVVRRATARDRDDRYPDAAAFASALRRAVPTGPEQLVIDDPGTELLARTATSARNGGTVVVEVEESDTDFVGSVGRVPPTGDDHLDGHDDADGYDEPDDDEPDDEFDTDTLSAPRRRRGRAWLVLLILLALVGGSALGGYLLWDRVLAPVTPIPGVLGAPEGNATEQLIDAGFEVQVADDEPFDLQVPAGHVYEQSPTGEARQGETITLVLSAGPRQIEVPEVVGDDADAAMAEVRAAGLDPRTTDRYDEQVPSGAVIETDPPAGVVIDEADTVELAVSLGRRPIEVPRLVGSSLGEASATVGDLGLTIDVSGSRFDEQAPRGTVLSQDPDPGTTRFGGDTVAVVTSDGPRPIEVPNVRDERVEEAAKTLRELGFEVEIELRSGFGAFLNPGRVYDQDPAPGATRQRGDTVLLFGYNG